MTRPAHDSPSDGPTGVLPPRALVIGVLAVTFLGLGFLGMDRGTIERGNRLYRAGDTLQAIEIYRSGASAATASGGTYYNLGTALVGLESLEADRLFGQALQLSDSAVLVPAYYNRAYGHLTSVNSEIPTDSAVALLRSAVENNRVALRLDVSNQDARWNLALSQRLLDSIALTRAIDDRMEPAGQDETRIEDAARTRSEEGEGESGEEPEDPRAAENIGLRRSAAAGAREAWATQDPGPLTDVDAMRLLAQVVDEPEDLVRGLLWAHRPDVAWWASDSYPGGDW